MIYKTSITGLLAFEVKSFLGRQIRLDAPKLAEGRNYLNLGCGSNYIKGFVNADFFSGFRVWRRQQRKPEWYLDLRYPLNCADTVFDGVFTEHTLEHLYPDEALVLLKELFRVMKNGSTIRITVPDLKKYVDFYTGQLSDDELNVFKGKFPTGAAAIRNLSQNYFHLSLWDFEELKRCMALVGFHDVQRKAYGDCSDPKLCLDLQQRSWETLYVEARKPN